MKKIDLKTHTKQGKARQRSGPVTRQLFYKVKAEIRILSEAGKYRAETVANRFGLGVSTVRIIKRAQSWPKFEAAKQAHNAGSRTRNYKRASTYQIPKLTAIELNDQDYRLAKKLEKYVIDHQQRDRRESSRAHRRIFSLALLTFIALVWITLLVLFIRAAA